MASDELDRLDKQEDETERQLQAPAQIQQKNILVADIVVQFLQRVSPAQQRIEVIVGYNYSSAEPVDLATEVGIIDFTANLTVVDTKRQ